MEDRVDQIEGDVASGDRGPVPGGCHDGGARFHATDFFSQEIPDQSDASDDLLEDARQVLAELCSERNVQPENADDSDEEAASPDQRRHREAVLHRRPQPTLSRRDEEVGNGPNVEAAASEASRVRNE